jgi:hypothetical protein
VGLLAHLSDDSNRDFEGLEVILDFRQYPKTSLNRNQIESRSFS